MAPSRCPHASPTLSSVRPSAPHSLSPSKVHAMFHYPLSFITLSVVVQAGRVARVMPDV